MSFFFFFFFLLPPASSPSGDVQRRRLPAAVNTNSDVSSKCQANGKQCSRTHITVSPKDDVCSFSFSSRDGPRIVVVDVLVRDLLRLLLLPGKPSLATHPLSPPSLPDTTESHGYRILNNSIATKTDGLSSPSWSFLLPCELHGLSAPPICSSPVIAVTTTTLPKLAGSPSPLTLAGPVAVAVTKLQLHPLDDASFVWRVV
ncbi:hypothetical protein LY78DRAFT_470246 [Colletotrichum sublineola]|nr:hypothetical protein LY78DRAFT_470246 [Colletotrichum sublineola]